jgi:hypothetical protein
MPNWKKVVTSGSNAQLNEVTSSGGIQIHHKATTSGTTGTTLLQLHNDVGSDISQQQTFIDFVFTDTNANFTPQVRIGAQVGQDADANSQEKEGAGAFVVSTADGSSTSGTLTEAFRVSYDGDVSVAGTVDGRDLASDGTKLDGIESGATADQDLSTYQLKPSEGAFVNGDKTKLDGIASSANNYVLPTNLAGDDINIDTGALTGATVISDLDFNITTNTSGLVTDANGTVSTRTLTAANLGVGSSDDVTFGSITISTGKIDYGTNTDVDTGTENVATATGAEAAFFDYVVKNGTNIRAGTITAATDGTNVEYNEVSTVDLGSTSDVKLKVVLSSSDLILQATTISDNWNVSSFVRYMAL